jgi:glyoxylase-like metal-dependent hydrolase (beta-lactamase superfamily II)
MRDLVFRQFFDLDSSTYTYFLMDSETQEGIIIDSVKEQSERDLKLVSELGLKLKYILETHVHADHTTGADLLKKATGANTAVAMGAGIDCSDIKLNDGEVLSFGSKKVRVITTPGHTDGCLSFYCQGRVFTGDSLMIRSAGRTDFQQGSAELLFNSIREKLFTLPDETLVYPGHDYQGRMVSTIGEEKKFNARIGLDKSKAEFIETMEGLKLPPPKKIATAVPANLKCGQIQT